MPDRDSWDIALSESIASALIDRYEEIDQLACLYSTDCGSGILPEVDLGPFVFPWMKLPVKQRRRTRAASCRASNAPSHEAGTKLR
jgi:hypothetical protein